MINCRAYLDITNAHALLIVQEWDSEKDLNCYIQSDEYRKYLALIDLSSTPPEISFNTISERKGLEFIDGVRGL